MRIENGHLLQRKKMVLVRVKGALWAYLRKWGHCAPPALPQKGPLWARLYHAGGSTGAVSIFFSYLCFFFAHFLPINHILFIFKHFFSLHIFIRPFGIIIRQFFFGRASLFLMLSLVLIISYVYHCFFFILCILLFLMFYFISHYNSTILTHKTTTLTLNKTQ